MGWFAEPSAGSGVCPQAVTDFDGKQSPTENGPETLGPFELLEKLGEGGMGAVYRARHLRLGKLMAVKVMHSHRLDDQELRSRFYREMRALGQLQHPNIVSAQHADEVDGVPYLAMEYVDGISLASLFHRLTADEQPVPISVVCELVRQAAEGIQYAHDQGVLHRDLKPGNLMLDREGRVRVLDLGLARMTESIESGRIFK
jgi:serine/threonine protein kinase